MIVDERFHFRPDFVVDLSKRPVPWGFDAFSEAIYFRTYSREKSDGGNERWFETVLRAVEGEFSILKWFTKRQGLAWDESLWRSTAERTATAVFEMKMLPPGRGLWAGGTEHIYKIGNGALNNCGYVDVQHVSNDAAWLMDHLMLGVGVGFRTDRVLRRLQMPYTGAEGIEKRVYTIPDSREGWVESVRQLIESYEIANSCPVDFDYTLIRPLGAKIAGFGGTASGPDPLRELHVMLRSLLTHYVWQTEENPYASSALVTDVMNLIGRCVVAGNVRRSAEIALGGPADQTFLNLKNVEQFPYRKNWMHLSNNSVILQSDADFELLPNLTEGMVRNGEPGFINLQMIQKYGRTGKPKHDDATGSNPCSEIPLESYELCCLVEVFPTRCKSYEFEDILELATIYATAISLLPAHDPRTNSVVTRNHRIGVSLSGLAEWKDKIGIPALTRRLRNGYRAVETTNIWLARQVGVRESIRLTTVKPSGTISLLAGVSSGMHHPWDRWSLRRVRVAANSPVAERLAAAGVPNEPDVTDPSGTLIFEFPIEYHSRPQSEVSIWEQLAFVAMLQRDWADNMVSNTITFGPNEEDQIGHALGMFAPVLKSTSVLPDLDAYATARGEASAYVQAPYEKIPRDEYRARRKAIAEIDWSNFSGSDGEDSKYCTTDHCEVKFG